MKSWIDALARTRAALANGIRGLFRPGSVVSREDRERLEEALVSADVPMWLAGKLLDDAAAARSGVPIRATVEQTLLSAFASKAAFSWESAVKPRVVLIVGVNGSGKTTTAAKLAWHAKRRGLTPILAAADTFRAAAAEQLRKWASSVGCDVIAGAAGADSAAVAFDAVKAGVSRGADLVIIDTAGRMHTKQPLMDEMGKIRRSIGKSMPGAPHETLLVLDATLGNNAVAQAKVFHEIVPLTGVVITKLDGSAKGGFIPAVNKELGVPVYFVGLGEGAEDLAPFDAAEFVKGLLGPEA
ncbi:MAG: signal recognition particle-docking protein FtsY [bacterium]